MELFNLGVANRDAEIEFSIPETEFGVISAGLAHIGSRINEFEEPLSYQFDRHRKVMARVVSLDNFLLPKLDRLDFIKIDIEGAEMWAFQGMKNMLQKFKPIVLCEFSPRLLKGFSIDSQEWEEQLREEYEYDIFSYDPNAKKISPQTRGSLVGKNYIFIPKKKLAQFKELIL